MPREVFLSLPSWSVECGNLAYDDARQSKDGIWGWFGVAHRSK